MPLATAEELSSGMQSVLDKEREFEQESNRIAAQKQALELQIRNLQLGAGEADPRLARVAEQVGGVLLSDVYDDISIDDAPYYSALYGPARSALVVLDLEGAIERLKKLEDCPEDIYLIQGNPDSFDEDLVEADELGDAVLVRTSKRQVRFVMGTALIQDTFEPERWDYLRSLETRKQKRSQQQQLLMQQKVAEQQLHALQQSLQRAKVQQQQLQEQLNQLSNKLQPDDEPELILQEQLQQILLEREEAEQQMIAQQELLGATEQQIRQLEQGQQGIVQILNKKRSELEELRLDSEGYRVRANNMLELLREQQASMKDILPQLPADAEEALWQQQLDKTIDAVGRLGPINLAAIEEYEQQAERKQYLDAQNNDLTSAMETLETAIRKIDKETRQKFKDTFEQVNEGLKTLFPKVFGGGSAYLALTEDDLLETGVTIMARPPGKKNSTIHLLSGGEKALTALSLVFSIFRLNPAPFCMLDEVDAPLDDANVGRFCNLVREMSETVQFIYISHNKIAMEMAAQLMGVTMQEPGVSRVVAVDVDDAVKMAAAS